VHDAARVIQPKVTATAEGVAAEEEAAAAAMAAGSARPLLLLVLWDVGHLSSATTRQRQGCWVHGRRLAGD